MYKNQILQNNQEKKIKSHLQKVYIQNPTSIQQKTERKGTIRKKKQKVKIKSLQSSLKIKRH